jgi:hypothetical protein
VPNALETEFECEVAEEGRNGVSAVENGLTNVNYFLFGDGNVVNDNKPDNSTIETDDKKDTDSGLGEGLVMETTDYTSKF